MVDLADDPRYESSYPAHMTTINDSWWRTLLNGTLWMVDLSTFPVPTTLAQFRSYCHRRAWTLGRRCMVHTPRLSGLVYLQAFEQFGVVPVMSRLHDAQPVPPVPKVYSVRPGAPPLPDAPSPRTYGEHRAAANQAADAVLATIFTEEWTKELANEASRLTPEERRQYEDDQALEALMMSRCTCGSKNVSQHAPDCGAWG
jgi:hypothetical protein